MAKKNESNPLEYYVSLAREAKSANRERILLYDKIDKIDRCEWSLPQSMQRLPGIRKRVLTDPHDALFAATRLFSTMMPNINVVPLAPNDEEMRRVEALEEWLAHQFFLANRRGAEGALWKIVNSALKYMCIAVQIEYLPYFRKGKTDGRTKNALRRGDFVLHVYDPRGVYADFGDDTINWIIAESEKTISAVIAEFGSDNEGVKALLNDIRSGNKSDKIDAYTIANTRAIVYDYTDWEWRVQWASIGKNGKEYELRNEKHGLSFFPWAFRRGDHPLLRSVVDADMWDDANLVASLESWMVLSAAAHPAYFTVTPSGKGIGISYTNPVGELRGRPGEDVRPLPPRQLDPHVSRILADLRSSIHGSTVTRALQTLDFGANTPFATVNAILSASVASLNMPRKLAEETIADILYLFLHWVAYSKIPSAIKVSSEGKNLRPGQQIVVTPEFPPGNAVPRNHIIVPDPDALEITVRLQADTPTDKQQRVNMAISLANLGIPKDVIAEELQIPNYNVLRDRWMIEQLEEAKLQARIREIVQRADLKIQQEAAAFQAKAQAEAQMQEQAQMQTEAQAQMGAEALEPNPAAQGAGFAPSMGGQPPQMVNPSGMTREEVTGRTWTGEEFADVG